MPLRRRAARDPRDRESVRPRWEAPQLCVLFLGWCAVAVWSGRDWAVDLAQGTRGSLCKGLCNSPSSCVSRLAGQNSVQLPVSGVVGRLPNWAGGALAQQIRHHPSSSLDLCRYTYTYHLGLGKGESSCFGKFIWRVNT